MDFVFLFLLLKIWRNTYFYSIFNINQILAKQMAQKTITFHSLLNTSLKKENVLLQPRFGQRFVFFNLSILRKTFFEQQTWLKIRKTNRDKEKGCERKTRQQNQQKQKTNDEKQTLTFNMLMLFFSWNKSKETREKRKRTTRKQKKRKQKREQQNTQIRKKENNEIERQKKKWKREKETETREKQRETLKTKEKSLSLGEKQFFCVLKAKITPPPKKPKQTKIRRG